MFCGCCGGGSTHKSSKRKRRRTNSSGRGSGASLHYTQDSDRFSFASPVAEPVIVAGGGGSGGGGSGGGSGGGTLRRERMARESSARRHRQISPESRTPSVRVALTTSTGAGAAAPPSPARFKAVSREPSFDVPTSRHAVKAVSREPSFDVPTSRAVIRATLADANARPQSSAYDETFLPLPEPSAPRRITNADDYGLIEVRRPSDGSSVQTLSMDLDSVHGYEDVNKAFGTSFDSSDGLVYEELPADASAAASTRSHRSSHRTRLKSSRGAAAAAAGATGVAGLRSALQNASFDNLQSLRSSTMSMASVASSSTVPPAPTLTTGNDYDAVGHAYSLGAHAVPLVTALFGHGALNVWRAFEGIHYALRAVDAATPKRLELVYTMSDDGRGAHAAQIHAVPLRVLGNAHDAPAAVYFGRHAAADAPIVAYCLAIDERFDALYLSLADVLRALAARDAAAGATQAATR